MLLALSIKSFNHQKTLKFQGADMYHYSYEQFKMPATNQIRLHSLSCKSNLQTAVLIALELMQEISPIISSRAISCLSIDV